MTKNQVAIGKRVRAKCNVDGLYLRGREGTIVEICEKHRSAYDVGVEFDEKVYRGHSCHGNGTNGYCRYGDNREFEIIEEPALDISITFASILE